MGPPRSAKSAGKVTSRPGVSKEFLLGTVEAIHRIATAIEVNRRYLQQTFSVRRPHRMRVLLTDSGFPRVTKRTTAAIIPITTTANMTLSGVSQVEAGAGVGVGVGGGAFFASSLARAYCRRWTVS